MRRLGAAVDLGTTSVAFSLFDLDSGQCLVRIGAENPFARNSAQKSKPVPSGSMTSSRIRE